MTIKGYHVGALLKGTGREIVDDGVPTLAAQTAYYFFFSLFPILLFLTPLLSLVGDERSMMGFIDQKLASMVGPEAFAPIRAAIEGVVFSDDAPGLMSTGALLAAWSGSNIFGALMAALNTAYDVQETRKWWKRQLIRLALFSIGVVVMILATVIMLAGEDITNFIGNEIGLGATGRLAWKVVQFPLALACLSALSFSVFYFLPNVRQDWRKVVVAAVVTTALWVLATLLFRLYVQNFASFNKTYGTIGGIIALLTWMYYSMFVVLSGGELAAELNHGTGATKPLRGAVYHNRIVSGVNAPSVAFGATPPRTE